MRVAATRVLRAGDVQGEPTLTTRGTLVFDVPPSATRGARLRVEDLFGGDQGFVRLGLD